MEAYLRSRKKPRKKKIRKKGKIEPPKKKKKHKSESQHFTRLKPEARERECMCMGVS